MADEAKKPESGSDNRTDAQLLKDNPALAQKLAEHIKPELFAQMADLDKEVADVLTKAKATVVNREAQIASVVASMEQGKQSGKAEWTKAQVAECLKGVILGMANRPYTINQEVDFNGLVKQALTPSVGSAGGNTMPDDFQAGLIKAADELSVAWPTFSVRPTGLAAVTKAEESSVAVANTGSDAKSSSATSSDVLAETAIVYTQQSWTMRYTDMFVPIHLDLLEDSPLNILDEVTASFANQMNVVRETQSMTGGGAAASQPVGLFNAEAGITAVALSATSLTFAAVLDFIQNIPQAYRANATMFAGSAAYFDYITDLATNIRNAAFVADKLPTVLEQSHVPSGKVVAGDMKRYVVYENRRNQVVSSVRAKTYSLDVAMVSKWDAHPTVTDAFRIGTGLSY